MSRKKHPEHVNHERWLVSYADFITLLFAFFVVLFASGQSDKRKQVKLAQAMQSAFNHNGIFDPHTKTPPISDEPGATRSIVPSPLSLPLPTALDASAVAANEQHIAEQVKGVIAAQIAHRKLNEGVVSLHSSSDGLVVSLREAGFFASGSADVRSDSLDVFRIVASALPHQPMRIEGHTDNVPIHTMQFATNWELSTARAATITRLLLAQHAVAPTEISAAGFAEFQPMADNSTETGRSQNRRVDIVLLRPAQTQDTRKSTQTP